MSQSDVDEDAGPGPIFQPGIVLPPSPFGSNSNYILYNSNAEPLLGVSLAIAVTEAVIFQSATGSNKGFNFQLNAYSAQSYTCAWQQYIAGMVDTQLRGKVNNWPVRPPGGGKNQPIINQSFDLMEMPGVMIPAGYAIVISLLNDNDGNVTGMNCTVKSELGITVKTVTQNLLSIPDVTPGDLAPIVAFELNLVGPGDGSRAVLSSGAGTLVYRATNELTAGTKLPSWAADQGIHTAEEANSVYSQMSTGSSTQLTQTFGIKP